MRQDNSDRAMRGAVSPATDASFGAPAPEARSFWHRWWPFFLAAGLLVAGVAALSVDCRLAQWRRSFDFPGELQNLFQTCEPFGDGLGVLLVVLAIHQLDPGRRWALARVLVCSWGAGLAANGVKMLIGRVRPRDFDFQGDVWTTFGDWLPWTGTGYGGQSFPSAHAATAAGLAMALVWLYPAGRWLFPALAVLVAGHRIESQAHYLSDVLCGGALGIVVAAGLLRVDRLSKVFDRLEESWRSSARQT